MGFDGSQIEDLDYNFAKWGGPKGTVPEPSQKAMKKFQQNAGRMQIDVSKAAQELQAAREEDVDEAMLERLEKATDEADDRLNKEIARLCSDSPSVEDLEKLPWRAKQGFIGWLFEQLSPEGGASGTKS